MTVSEIAELVDLMRAKGVLELTIGDVVIRMNEGKPADMTTRPLSQLSAVPEEPEPDLTLWSSPFDPTLRGA
jgi:hypothetical protein